MPGVVAEMLVRNGKVVSVIRGGAGSWRSADGAGNPGEVVADYVIDCTGVENDISEHPVLLDLLVHSGVGRNPLGRLDVERTFEIRGASSGPGAMYASGASTQGGYLPGVDSFLGLQIAAQEIADDLARRGFCPRLGTIRSVSQWLRWARNREP